MKFNLDDIIIPRLGDTYYMEFEKVFALYPQAAAVAYNMTQASIASCMRVIQMIENITDKL